MADPPTLAERAVLRKLGGRLIAALSVTSGLLGLFDAAWWLAVPLAIASAVVGALLTFRGPRARARLLLRTFGPLAVAVFVAASLGGMLLGYATRSAVDERTDVSLPSLQSSSSCDVDSADQRSPSGEFHLVTSGGSANTWTNPCNAGGYQGPAVEQGESIEVSCRLNGFAVSNGNDWWYRIESAPWSGVYWVSADAFYNNGQQSGSLQGTPLVDSAIPACT